MGFTFIASASGDRDAAGSTLDCSSDLNVLAGDLLVVFVRWYTTDTSIAVAEVGAGNSFTMRATQESGSVHLASGYVLEATEDSTATFRATWGASVQYSGLTVLQFRPDSGETVTFEDDAPAIGESAVALTGAASAVGTDLLAVSGHSYWYWWQLAEFVNVAMAGGEPDDYIYDRSPTNINLVTMYKVFTESQTDITAEYEQTDIDFFAANILLFKSVAPSFTFIAEVEAYASASGTILDCSSTLNVQAGDLLVGISMWQGTDTTADIKETPSGNNDFTMLSHGGISANWTVWGYKISATANATALFRTILGSAQMYRYMAILQFRPASGYVVSLDTGPNPGTGTSNAPQSGNITTTGINELICGLMKCSAYVTITDEQIADQAADGSWDIAQASTGGCIWYKLFEATQSNIHAQATLSSTPAWVCDIIAFKAVSGVAKFATLADTIGITDVLTKIAGKIRSIADTVGITDLLRARRDIGFIGSAKNQASGSGTILDASPSLNVQAGDVLVCVTRWYNADAICTVADSVSGNSFTMNDRIDHVSLSYVRTGYVLDADADADFVGRMTLSVAGTYRAIIIFQFRPASGKTVVLDNSQVVDMTTGTIITSPNITTTGLAEIVIGAFHSHSYSGITDLQIDNTTPDGEEICTDGPSSDYAAAAFSIFNAIKTNINAAITFSSSEEGSASIFSLKILTGAAKFATLFDTVGITDVLSRIGGKIRSIVDTVGITDIGYETADIAVIDGEDIADVSPWEFDGVITGRFFLDAAAALHGTRGYRIEFTNQAAGYGWRNCSDIDKVYVRQYLKIISWSGGWGASLYWPFILNGSTRLVTFRQVGNPSNQSSSIYLRHNGGEALVFVDNGNNFIDGQPYFLEFHYKQGGIGVGGFSYWRDGVLQASDYTTYNTSNYSVNRIMGGPNAGTGTDLIAHIDDILVSTTGPIGPYSGVPSLKTSRNIFKVIQDTIATTDVISTARNIFRSISDIVGVIDILTRGKKFFRTITDTVGIIDILLIVKFKERIVDSFGRSRIARVLGIKKSKIARVSGIDKSDIIKSDDPDNPDIVGK